MIEVQSVTARYGRVIALNSVSFRVRAGEFLGLLGPNGAGKSTLIRAISGLHPVDSGTLTVCGLSPSKNRRKVAQQIGVIPQQLALYASLSVQENLRIFGGLHGLSGHHLRERVNWGLQLAQLTRERSQRVRTLSGGMKRRLNLAASLLHAPTLVICDEPTAGVDPQSRSHIFETLRSLHRDGTTIVYTTHYLEEVEALCERVVILDKGSVVAQGSLSELLNQGGVTQIRLTAPVARDTIEAALRSVGVEIEACRGQTLEEVLLELTSPSP